MAMTLNLEVAQGISLENIKDALAEVEFADLSETESGFSVALPKTNSRMSVKTNIDNTMVLAEEFIDPDWLVGLRAYFEVDATLPNPFDDIKRIIQNLSDQTSFKFVLSFQYESIYAQKGSDGLETSDDF